MAAEYGLIFCGGDCCGVVAGQTSNTSQVFSAVKPLEVYIQPDTGHAMNVHYNATGRFDVMSSFLGENGL